MRKIMLTGGAGMLGRTICKVLGEQYQIIPTDLPETDITSPESIEQALVKFQPDTVIHCAAMTAVDRCETERELAFLLNEQGSSNVASVCKKFKVRLIAISTDYVFNGNGTKPYSEDDPADGGATVYGQSKFAGEQAIRRIYPENSLICRTAWLYGFGGPSFVHTMLKLADGTRNELKVVHDQIGNPTSAVALARKLGELIEHPELTGTYHLSCEGECSWYEFAVEIFRQKGITQKVVPCTTEEYPRPAPRPKNSRLDKMNLRRTGLTPMPHWTEALRDFFQCDNEKS